MSNIDDNLEIPEFMRRSQPTSAEDIVEALDAQSEAIMEDDDPLGLGEPEAEAPSPPKKRYRKVKAKADEPENPRARSGGNSPPKERLKAIVERIERMEEAQSELAEDKKEIYVEAKSNGFDTKTLRKVISLRKRDAAERAEEEALLDLYLFSLGMV